MGLWQDVRFAARLFVKERGFTAAVVLILALGLGINTAVFTIVNTILLRGVPYAGADRLVALGTIDARAREGGVSWLDFQDLRSATQTLEGITAAVGAPMNLSEEGRPADQYPGIYINANVFRMIRQTPIVGRDFSESDDRIEAEPVLIIGHKTWQNRYGGDPSAIGRPVRVNGRAYTIIGVMGPGIDFPFNNEIWVPYNKLPPESLNARRNVRNSFVFGRLKDGITIAQARAEVSAFGANLTRTYPDTNKDINLTIAPFNERVVGQQLRLTLLSLMGAVGFVLLIACANVANLLLARSGQRAQEIAVRVSMGASRWRIVRQLLIESVMLSLAGGVAGLAVAVFGIRLFDSALSDPNLGKPAWMTFDLDPVVFVFLGVVCVGCGVLFGLAPALQTSRTDINTVLKDAGGRSAGGSRSHRWTSVLVMVEVALTVVLLASAGFMMRSFLTLYRMDLGMNPANVLTMNVFLPLTRYSQPQQRAQVVSLMDERLKTTPGFENSAFMTNIPMFGGFERRFSVAGRPDPQPEERPTVTMLSVTPRYFGTMGMTMRRGRAFEDADGTPGHLNAVVNERFVAKHFATENPIGAQLTLYDPVASIQVSPPKVVTIIGVSPTVRQRDINAAEADAVVYLPYSLEPQRSLFLAVRAPSGDSTRLAATLREEMRLVEPDLPLANIRTMEQMLALSRWSFRIFGTMFAVFAGIALVLSAVGLYAVTAYAVAQRVPEIGVRMALGAQPLQVLWLVLRRALVQLVVGVPLGIAGALGAHRLLQSVIVSTTTPDIVTLPTIVVLMVAISIVACLIPARRATMLEPATVLR